MGNRTESKLMIAKVEITKEMYHLTLRGKWLFDKIVTKRTYSAEIDEHAAGCKEGLCGIKTATYIVEVGGTKISVKGWGCRYKIISDIFSPNWTWTGFIRGLGPESASPVRQRPN